MHITFRDYKKEDITLLKDIWNDILIDGVAFPGEDHYEEKEFENMLEEQSAVTCILVDDEVAGYYILHPNNIGRCSHVANASYAISKLYRGRKLADPLVKKSIEQARELGFRGMQFNAVVSGNSAAIHTYQKAGFKTVGTIPEGFRLKSGVYSDMHIMYLHFS
ncbi:GNAT family N-acetyltransferase [Paenibacillus agri]|uniref:GNAT family N-acetyltransferase n=1 Tax=Paenibacillus agri TaxID=2744309 RepID=A0A850EPA0_9BACL|nr:GNAT family N-acetyltransferase [Paenibacillus agri]NUU62286.1 GNAT family N-acetyltransferase [Paenibacillus agri]